MILQAIYHKLKHIEGYLMTLEDQIVSISQKLDTVIAAPASTADFTPILDAIAAVKADVEAIKATIGEVPAA